MGILNSPLLRCLSRLCSHHIFPVSEWTIKICRCFPFNKSSMCIFSHRLFKIILLFIVFQRCSFETHIFFRGKSVVPCWVMSQIDLTKTHEEIRRESPNRPDNCDSVTMGFPIAYLRVTLQIAPSVTGFLLPRPRSKSKEVRSSVWEFPADFFWTTKFGPWSVPSWSLRCNPKMAP